MNVLDLFSGAAGGWSLGLHRAGYRTVAACEIEADRRRVYSANFPGVKVYDDVRTLTADRLAADGVGSIEVVAGSPPCQDASEANHRGQGVDGDRTGLFFEFVRLVREVRPRWVLAENVPRLRTRGYDRVHDALVQAGYTPRPFVVGAAHIGAPHIRKRVWIIANASGVDGWPGAGGPNGTQAGDGSGEPQGEQVGRVGQPRPEGFDPDSERQLERAFDGEMAWLLEHPWAGGLAGRLRMAHGVPGWLARFCRSAYGDAVLPQITEAIGRAVKNVNPDGRAAASPSAAPSKD